MKPLIKTEWKNLPLSVPAPWKEFFDNYAQKLGVSRNAALCLALKLGGPILERYFHCMEKQLHQAYEQIGTGDGVPIKLPGNFPGNSEILGPPAQPPNRATQPAHERRKERTNRR